MLGLKSTIQARRHELEHDIRNALACNDSALVHSLNCELRGIDYALVCVEHTVHTIKAITNAIE